MRIGLTELYYAILTSDPAGGTPVYATPVRIRGAISANINPNTSAETLFADDGPYATATTIGDIELALNVAELTLDEQAALLGHTVSGGILKRKSTDNPPWVAIGFKTLKANNSYRWTWLNKGKFRLPEQNNETKGDSINFQTPTINGNFVKRDADDEWERHIDEDHDDYLAALGTAWFTDPLGSGDTTAPTLDSSVPTDGAAAVAVDTTIAMTFSEAMALSTLTTDNFFLSDVTTGAPVAGALTVNAARTVVTFTPTANLSAATEYRMNITTSVTDLSGNKLAAHNHIEFTTA